MSVKFPKTNLNGISFAKTCFIWNVHFIFKMVSLSSVEFAKELILVRFPV